MAGKKKKGRPSLKDLKRRALENSNRRSTRRNPSSAVSPPPEEQEEHDEDERERKKVKLVIGLPQSNPHNSSDDDADEEIEEQNSGSAKSEKVAKATQDLHESPSGPTTTPLPDKKLLAFILDRLQKKDTYGVFSEPVDPNELPDYFEMIEHPMDFGTVRNKLDQGLYSNLEELEADVFLICSNAMQYNSSDTIYFRQAKSIQELAKRDFENLRQEGEDGELQPKVIRRGRPPNKHTKKPPSRPPVDHVAPELPCGGTLAKVEDKVTESTPYNLRRGSIVNSSHRSRSGEHYSEWLIDWNDEFPAKILRADMKYGKKHFSIDETRRDTYKQFHPSAFASEPSLFTKFGGDRKHLVSVGLHAEHGYARSLARFAANLGPIVWKIASQKIEKALPPGVKFGPGQVGENEPCPPPSFFSSKNKKYSQRLTTGSLPNQPDVLSTFGLVLNKPNKGDMVESDKRMSSQNDLSAQSQHNKTLMHTAKNRLNGMYTTIGSVTLRSGASKVAEKATIQDSATVVEGANSGKPSSLVLPTNNKQSSLPVPQDLNGGPRGTGSTGSGLRIGSPQQPDLALQL